MKHAFWAHVGWEELLKPLGFALIKAHANGMGYWHHPADHSPPSIPSATTDAVAGHPRLVVWSENAARATGLPPGSGQGLTKFKVWSYLYFDGDEELAYQVLAELVGHEPR